MFGLSATAWVVLALATVGAMMAIAFVVLPGVINRDRPKRTWFQRGVLVFASWLVVSGVVIGAGLGYVHESVQAIPRVRISESVLAEPVEPGEPQNFLIVGVDSSEGLDPDDPVQIGRNPGSLLTDNIMVLRVDPEEETAHLLSFPRDLWIPIAGTGGRQRINTALSAGGPETLIRTIEDNFEIPINHYVQVDFKGFSDLVEIIDGVPLYFPEPVRDRNSGLAVDVEPGGECVVLDGPQALAFVRARHYETRTEDGWETDPTGDLGRIDRQQQFLRAALDRAIDKGFRNPSRLDQAIGVAQESVTLDDELTTGDLLDLGEQFADFEPDNFLTYSLPVELGRVGEASVVFLIQDEAKPILDTFRGVAPMFEFLPAVRVGVLNGSGELNQGAAVLGDLDDRGFGTTRAGDADRFDYARTQIRYAPGEIGPAILVARFLDADPEFVEVADLGEETVVVVTGQDLEGVLDEPLPAEDFEHLLPTDVTTTAVPSTTVATTTTTIGDVPEQSVDC